MPRDAASAFSYIDLLADLELQCREIAPRMRGDHGELKNEVDHAHRTRTRDVSEGVVSYIEKLFLKLGDPGEKIAVKMSASAELLGETEKRLLSSIELNTSHQTEPHLRHARPWPEPVPVDRMLSRAMAMTLGLHAEQRGKAEVEPAEDLHRCMAVAVREIVAPCLAWRLLTDVTNLNADIQTVVLASLREYIAVGMIGNELGHPDLRGKIDLPSLVLTKAWHNCLAARMEQEVVECLHAPLRDLLDTADASRRREELLGRLSREFGGAEHTTDRARAVELAQRHRKSAAFFEKRLQLLDAAHASNLADFSMLARTDLSGACKEAADELRRANSDPLVLAGFASWLARECFRRTVGYEFNAKDGRLNTDQRDAKAARSMVGPDSSNNPETYNKASSLVGKLLERSIQLTADEPAQRLLARRFLAGFSTNPRYWHSSDVCANAQRWTMEYARCEGSLPSLVSQFHGRILWRDSGINVKPGKADLRDVAKAYLKALTEAGSRFEGLDAEAPIHLFAEIAVLLRQRGDKDQLAVIDFILSRNFAVYMDIHVEQLSIESGLEQSRGHLKAIRQQDEIAAASEAAAKAEKEKQDNKLEDQSLGFGDEVSKKQMRGKDGNRWFGRKR